MSATEGIFWAAVAWSVFFLYSLFDVPALMGDWLRGHR